MGWFHGTTDREFLDNRHVSGNVFKLMDEAMAFCFKHLNLSAKIGGKLERDEALEVPAAALREAQESGDAGKLAAAADALNENRKRAAAAVREHVNLQSSKKQEK